MAQTIRIKITDRTGENITRAGAEFEHGQWAPDGTPPAANALSFSVTSNGVMTGVEGYVVYSGPSGSATLRFDNPYMGKNEYGFDSSGKYMASCSGTQGTNSEVEYWIRIEPPLDQPPSPPGPSASSDVDNANTPVVAPSPVTVSKKRKYNRDAAIEYAYTYYEKPCSDGFMTLGKKPFYHEFQTSELNVNPNDYIFGRDRKRAPPWGDDNSMDDCTHFVSCCIGTPTDAAAYGKPSTHRKLPEKDPKAPPRAKAGGLHIKHSGMGTPWMYGQVSVPKMVEYLVKVTGIGKFVSHNIEKTEFVYGEEGVPRDIEAGDLIVYYPTKEVKPRYPGAPRERPVPDVNRDPMHFMFYLGNRVYACHTTCRRDIWPRDKWYLYKFIKIVA